MKRPIHVSLLAFPDVTVSSVTGMLDVFNSFALLQGLDEAIPDSNPFMAELVSTSSAPLRTGSGVVITPHRSLAEVTVTDIVIIPSLSLEGLPMADIPGVTHYEERMLFTLSLLKHPRAHLVYVTSQPLHPATIDYLLSLLQGIPMAHARQRLTMLATYDASPRTLTEKILERPRVLERMRRWIGDPERAYLTCYNSTALERRLAVELGIPLNSVDPAQLDLGTKTGSRMVFEEAGVAHQ